MKSRRSHYELAFEAYLDRRGTPYVAVEDVKQVTRGRTGAKAFDYIVYPPDGKACLVDVKGRKSIGPVSMQDCRTKNWVTRDDLSGMEAWQQVFGPQYSAWFVFAFWLAEIARYPQLHLGVEPLFSFAGRHYSFWLVPLEDYARHTRPLSVRWDTVLVPKSDFDRISRHLEQCWQPAPC